MNYYSHKNQTIDTRIHHDKKELTISISERVFNKIKETLGTEKPELGGILGYDEEKGLITDFYLDKNAKTTSATYIPDSKGIDRILNDDWELRGIGFVGFIHSHPCGFNRPSSADIEYGARIARDFGMDYVFLPIVTSSHDSKFDIMGYYVTQKGQLHACSLEIVEEDDNTEGRNEFTRISEVIDINQMASSTIIGVGCGGARNFFIDMARLGVGNFILIDGDSYAVTNIGSQGANHSELGKLKVEVIKEKILDVNPAAKVITHPFMLDDKVTDKWIELNLLKEEKVILCSFTDSVKAQLRCANIAAKYKLNFITGSHFQGGYISELVYSCPQAETDDPRDLLVQRYLELKNNNYKSATSEGSPVFVANRLMALAEKIVTGILLYPVQKDSRFCSFLNTSPKFSAIYIRETSLTSWDESWQSIFEANDCDIAFDDVLWLSKDNVGDESIIFIDSSNTDTRNLDSFQAK